MISATLNGIVSPLVLLWDKFVNIIPGLVAAIVILFIGYLLATICGYIVRIILKKLGSDKFFKNIKLNKDSKKLEVSLILGTLTKWYIFLVFLESAVSIINLGSISIFLNHVVLWLPNLIIATLILFLGLAVAEYIAYLLHRNSAFKNTKIVIHAFKWLIVFLTLTLALEQIGVEVGLLKQTFLIILAAVSFAIALAVGLIFGLGLKNRAPYFYKELKRKL